MITPQPIRLFCDLNDPFTIEDLNTDNAPEFVDGDDIEFDIGIGEYDQLLTGLTTSGAGGIASITCEVFDGRNSQNPALMSQTTSSLNTTLTQSEWASNTTPYYHANFKFANGATAILAAGANDTPFWLRIFITTSDTPAKIITILEGQITVKAAPLTNVAAALPSGWKLVTDITTGQQAIAIQFPGGYYRALQGQSVNGVDTIGLSDQQY